MSSYSVRKLKIGKTELLDQLAHECGQVYTQTVVWFWRTVRRQEKWLKPKHMMRWINSDQLHAHTADACVQSFFASLKSWRERRKVDPNAHPPRRRKWYFKIEYKSTAIRQRDGKLILSNGRNVEPLILDWPWKTPKTVVVRWQGEQYEAIATYVEQPEAKPLGDKVAGIDLGEIHIAVAHDGENCTILNGRLLRSKRFYQNKLKAKLSKLIDTKKKGSRRRKRIICSKQRQLTKVQHQIKDVLHKQTSRLVSTLYQAGVQTLAIGDVRDIRHELDFGAKTNQKLHQWSFGDARHMLTYKAERLGMSVHLQEERDTTKTCPGCGKRHKPKNRDYKCKCGFVYHRDGVGSLNIRRKYLGSFDSPVFGVMASPVGVRFRPHLQCSSGGRNAS